MEPHPPENAQTREPDSPSQRADFLLHELFERQAIVSPQAIALVSSEASFTYDELDQRTNRLAHLLSEQGARPDALVAIILDSGALLVEAILATLKCGCGYLPLDPNQPTARLESLLGDAQPLLLITTADTAAALEDCRVQTLAIDDPAVLQNWASQPAAALRPRELGLTSASLGYLIYTSGSTGAPKGVVMPQGPLLHLINWHLRCAPEQSGLRTLQFSAPAFDVAFQELFSTLASGGSLVLATREQRRDVQKLVQLIQHHRIERLFLPFIALAHLVDYCEQHRIDLPSLKHVITAGEPLRADAAIKSFFSRHPQCRLHNHYGPSESHVVTVKTLPDDPTSWPALPSIGRAIGEAHILILNAQGEVLTAGAEGEIAIAGPVIARGYLNRPELTEQRFKDLPAVGRVYLTGDLGFIDAEGDIRCLGRADDQVKVLGHRVELGEIETRLREHADIADAAVTLRNDLPFGSGLVAYLTARHPGHVPNPTDIRAWLAQTLPQYMLPAVYNWLKHMPISVNGKLDRRALPMPEFGPQKTAANDSVASTSTQDRIRAAFTRVLGLGSVTPTDNFFDIGGNSLLVMRVLSLLEADGVTLSASAFFSNPTPAALAEQLDRGQDTSWDEARRMPRGANPQDHRAARAGASVPIAIVGMAGRFPGPKNVQDFWDMLLAGADGIKHLRDDELDPSLPSELTNDPLYVKARGLIDDVDSFDPAFFGISPREALLMDPQQRIFLELCWECLEHAGHAPDLSQAPVGVFAGMHNASYFLHHVQHRPDLIDKIGDFAVMLANEKDYIATRIANRLNLTGPAVSVHTACSTSLVAVAQAVTSLRAGQCDMALAGGVAVTCPPNSGYLYQEGAMLSPDGVTRTFDAQAQGTVFSDGAAVVLLKRLSDAQDDGDTIYAVIRGVAINNDGRDKASFTAPSLDGQAAVITAALADAGVSPRSVSYVECHGTATPLGDPVEVEALTRAFRRQTADIGFCRLGSAKSNIGHTLTAAGVTGVIKTALALAEECIPPSIHYTTPNPKIDFASSPFIVNDALTTWASGEQPRRAGVSSFGVGGTNAHIILEEAPATPTSSPASGPQLLMLSARSPSALDAQVSRLTAHLREHPDVNLADVAYTLQVGRSPFAQRLCLVCETPEQAIRALSEPAWPLRSQRTARGDPPPQIWLFPGQGAQYPGMGSGLYAAESDFRAALDDAIAACAPHLSFDLRARLFSADPDALASTQTTQPATFCIEYALAQTWLARGAKPIALIGHSIGEFAAAVLVGVLSLADAARLIARRGALMQALTPGSMLSVRLSADDLRIQLPDDISLAAINGPTSCVIAGPTAAISSFDAALQAQGVQTRLLQTSHAFHSAMMEPALAAFRSEVANVALAPARLPIVSTLTGRWLTPAEAVDAEYWVRHLREPVRFSAAVRDALDRHANAVFLEIGPRRALSTLVRQHAPADGASVVAIPSLADAPEQETACMLLAAGALWTAGIALPVSAAHPPTNRHRISLPTYPFERQRYWIEAVAQHPSRPATTPASDRPAATSSIAPAAQTLTSTSIEPVPAMSIAQPIPTAPLRKNRLIAQLRDLFEDVSGHEASGADPGMAFVELGLDSLTLTQAALQIKKQFGVPVTFRQLMENLRSFDLLADYLDAQLEPEPAAMPAPSPSPLSAPLSAPLSVSLSAPLAATPPHFAVLPQHAPADAVQWLIQQQMQLMSQQLALLGGQTMIAPQTPPPMPMRTPTRAPETAPPPAANASPAQPLPAAPDANGEDSAPLRYDVKKAFGAIARIHTQSSPLTERQKVRLATFMRRYVERTAKSRAYTVQYRDHLADPRVVNGFRPMTKEITYQIVVNRSKGARLWDLDGNEYVDALNGFGMNLFGWQPDFVLDAVRRQLDDGYDIGPQHPLAGPVADLICELTGFDRAGLCNTGSEAVMAAVRIARTVTGRNTVVLFSGSYHGTFDEVVVRPGKGGKGIPGAPGIMRGMFGDVRVLDYGTPESLEFIRVHADELAAVLVEPVQSRRPEFQPVEFLKEIRAITERSGACLIFDEVITGFRSALGGTQQLFGIRADLATYGKVIGGGMPIGVVAGRREFIDALDGGAWQYGDDSIPTIGVTYFAGTFVRHPLALAAAHASLLHLKAQGPALQGTLNAKTAQMADELTAFCRQVGAPLEIRHFASLWRVGWLEDHPLQDLLFAMMRSRGVHILDNFPCFLTTAHSETDIRLIVEAFKDSVRELQEAEFLPQRKSSASASFDASHPPVPGARIGKDPGGNPAWFVPNPEQPGKYLRLDA